MFLLLYNFFLYLLSPIIFFIIILRVFLGKEHKQKYREKLGLLNSIDKKGEKLIWFHAASLGELKSIFPIVNELNNNKNLEFLITSKLHN